MVEICSAQFYGHSWRTCAVERCVRGGVSRLIRCPRIVALVYPCPVQVQICKDRQIDNYVLQPFRIEGIFQDEKSCLVNCAVDRETI